MSQITLEQYLIKKAPRGAASPLSLLQGPRGTRSAAPRGPANVSDGLLDMSSGSVAEFERSMMLERQREGMAKAKADGKYKGRAPTAQAKAEDVLRLLGDGMGACQVASQLGISRSSVWADYEGQRRAPRGHCESSSPILLHRGLELRLATAYLTRKSMSTSPQVGWSVSSSIIAAQTSRSASPNSKPRPPARATVRCP